MEHKNIYNTPLKDWLHLASPRLKKIFSMLNITTFGALIELERSNLKKVKGIGEGTLNLIDEMVWDIIRKHKR